MPQKKSSLLSSLFQKFRKQKEPLFEAPPQSASESAPQDPVEINKVVIAPKNEVSEMVQPQKMAEESILDSIVSQSQVDKEEKSVLGPKPSSSSSITTKYSVERRFQSISLAFQFVVYLSLVSLAFFFIALNKGLPYFEDIFNVKTPAQKFIDILDQVKQEQTVMNFKRLSLVKQNMDTFIYLADQYTGYSGNLDSLTGSVNSASGIELSKNLDEVLFEMHSILASMKEQLSFSIIPEEMPNPYVNSKDPIDDHVLSEEEASSKWQKEYETALLDYVESEKAGLQNLFNGQGSKVEQDLKQNIEVYNSIPVIFQKTSFLLNSLSEIDDKTLSKKTIRNLVKEFNSVSKNNLSIIANVKNQRINWTQNLNYIDKITLTLDSFFTKNDAALGKIFYNSYSFDASKNSIILSGDIRTLDEKIFDEVLKTIEAFESSPYFELVNEIRKFSKTKQDQKYLSNISLTLRIKEPEEIESALPVPRETNDLFTTAPSSVTGTSSPSSPSDTTNSPSATTPSSTETPSTSSTSDTTNSSSPTSSSGVSTQSSSSSPTDASTQPSSTSPTDASTQPSSTSPTDTSTQPSSTSPTDASTQPSSASSTDASTQPSSASSTDASTQPSSRTAAPESESSEPSAKPLPKVKTSNP
ncbi:hypothetical protein HYV57_04490 [Candidatus Peregrinibacteria bacterium]|nr:hypothetical protein [Candidatus Peregrinibacteria bacterium]